MPKKPGRIRRFVRRTALGAAIGVAAVSAPDIAQIARTQHVVVQQQAGAAQRSGTEKTVRTTVRTVGEVGKRVGAPAWRATKKTVGAAAKTKLGRGALVGGALGGIGVPLARGALRRRRKTN